MKLPGPTRQFEAPRLPLFSVDGYPDAAPSPTTTNGVRVRQGLRSAHLAPLMPTLRSRSMRTTQEEDRPMSNGLLRAAGITAVAFVACLGSRVISQTPPPMTQGATDIRVDEHASKALITRTFSFMLKISDQLIEMLRSNSLPVRAMS